MFFDVLTPEEKTALAAFSERVAERIDPASCARADEILSGEPERLTAS
jgi:hypothetical protein